MPTVNLDDERGRSLRLAALGALSFGLLFALHHLLQGTGPAGSSAAEVARYNTDHRGAMLGSEVALGLALLAFIPFLAGLVPVLWRAGQQTYATAVLVAGTLLLALGFVSTAAETALVGVAGTGEAGAVDALNQLQGRTPVVWSVAALTAAVSLALRQTGLGWRWLAVSGLVVSVVFLLASVSNLVGRDVEGGYSLIGVGLFIAWMWLLAGGLWRAARRG